MSIFWCRILHSKYGNLTYFSVVVIIVSGSSRWCYSSQNQEGRDGREDFTTYGRANVLSFV